MRSAFGSVQRTRNGCRIFWTWQGVKHSKTIRGTCEDGEIELARIRLNLTGEINNCSYNDYWNIAVTPTFARISPKTASTYKHLWERELSPRIGSKDLQSTTPAYVERVLYDIDKASVAQACFRLWKKVCNMAMKDGIITRNPLTLRIDVPKHRPQKKTLYEAEEIKPLLESIKGLKYEPIILCELGGGLRHEEACALTWEDITDFNGYALVSVSKALIDVDGTRYLKETKTSFSEREVILGEPFASRLLELKDSGIILTSRLPVRYVVKPENYSSPVTVTHNWRSWCQRNKIKYVCPKNLRSNYATLHAEAGSIDSVVSFSMGHSDGTTKGTYYQKSTRRSLMAIADNLAEMLESL